MPDRPFKSIFLRAFSTIFPALINAITDKIYSKFLSECAVDFNIVFVVNGQTLSPKILRILKKQYPSAKYYLYMWDSFSNRPKTIDKLVFFDSISTFDPKDAIEYSLNFRPLFFSDKKRNIKSSEIQFDWSFIGTSHSDRYSIIKKIISLNPTKKSFVYLYLQAKWVFWIMKLTNKSLRRSKLNDFKFVPLSKLDVAEVFSLSGAILDIEHPKQVGLTMRTFEVLGAGKKLITTNKYIKDYDFYNPNNICIVDRILPNIPDYFFDSIYQELPDSLNFKYCISGWLDNVLNPLDEGLIR